jgi:O-antigen/teichoic acid export membrane protein
VDLAAPSCGAIAPVRGWRRLFADSLTVGVTTIICQVLGVFSSVLFRALLDPAQMGIWQGLKLVLSYGNYANLGVSKGAARELTIALGRGDRDAAQRNVNLAFTVNLLTSLLYALVLAGAAVWIAWTGAGGYSVSWSLGLAAMGLLAGVQRHVNFQINVLRSKQQFRATSLLSVLEAAMTLGLGVTAAWLWGLRGLYLATLGTLIVSAVYLSRADRCWPRLQWDRREIRRLAVIGAPMLGIALLTSLNRSIDRWMILSFSSNREFELGCYSLSLLVATQLSGVASVFAIVMQPRYGELLGSSGAPNKVARLAARMTELKGAVVALAGVLAIVAGPPFLGWLLPDYEAGLAPLVIRVPGIAALALAIPATQFLITVNRQSQALLALAPPTIAATAGCWYALQAGLGLTGVAWAMTLSDILYLLIVAVIAFARELPSADCLRYAGALGLAIGPLIALNLLRIGHPRLLEGANNILLGAAMILLWSLMVVLGWRLGGWSVLSRRDTACDAYP